MDAEILVELTRGALVEAVHRGHVAVVDTHDELMAWVGDPDHCCYIRSSAKPLQLLPMLEDGIDRQFGFSDAELAVMAASHSGEERHTRAVARILARAGLDESALRCGVHAPLHRETRRQMAIRGEKPTALHNNCSGKHAAMLVQAQASGFSLDDYLDPAHPIQQRILGVIREMTGAEPIIGVDGCGVPVFGLPLRAMALGYARLIDPRDLAPGRAAACRRVTAAMRAHPGMVSGEGRLEEVLAPATHGQLLIKGGAEGLYAVGIPAETSPIGRGLGLVLKMEDGYAGERAIDPALLEALAQLGVLDVEGRAALACFDVGPVYNHRRDVVGEKKTVFRLHRG
jgi:L-asparaginase II